MEPAAERGSERAMTPEPVSVETVYTVERTLRSYLEQRARTLDVEERLRQALEGH